MRLPPGLLYLVAIYIFSKGLAEDVNDRFAGVELDAIESLEEGEGVGGVGDVGGVGGVGDCMGDVGDCRGDASEG